MMIKMKLNTLSFNCDFQYFAMGQKKLKLNIIMITIEVIYGFVTIHGEVKMLIVAKLLS